MATHAKEDVLAHPLIRAIIQEMDLNPRQIRSGLNIFRTILDEQESPTELDYTTKIQIYDENNVVAVVAPHGRLKQQLQRQKYHLLSHISSFDHTINFNKSKTIAGSGARAAAGPTFLWQIPTHPENNREALAAWFKEFFQAVMRGGGATLQGCYLVGPSGVGKTAFLATFANYLIEKKKTVALLRLRDLNNYLKKCFERSPQEIDQVIETARGVDVLLVDDLGAERGSEWLLLSVFYPILDGRQAAGRLTCFSSSLTQQQLQARFAKTPKIDNFLLGRLLDCIQSLAREIFLPGTNLKGSL